MERLTVILVNTFDTCRPTLEYGIVLKQTWPQQVRKSRNLTPQGYHISGERGVSRDTSEVMGAFWKGWVLDYVSHRSPHYFPFSYAALLFSILVVQLRSLALCGPGASKTGRCGQHPCEWLAGLIMYLPLRLLPIKWAARRLR